MIDFLADVGIGRELLILLLTVLGSAIFIAKDFRLFVMICFVLIGLELVVLYSLNLQGYNFVIEYHIIALMTNLVLLVVSILTTYQRTAPQEVA